LIFLCFSITTASHKSIFLRLDVGRTESQDTQIATPFVRSKTARENTSLFQEFAVPLIVQKRSVPFRKRQHNPALLLPRPNNRKHWKQLSFPNLFWKTSTVKRY